MTNSDHQAQSRDVEETQGNALAAINGLLSSLGIEQSAKRESIEDTVQEVLLELGLSADVTGVRYGTMTLSASAADAAYLRYETENIVKKMKERGQGEVTSVKVTVKRPKVRRV